MRLDKFFKVSRVIKRRTVAKEVCDQGLASINGRPAKAGSEVKPGDLLSVTMGKRILKIRVISTPETVKAQDAAQLYEVIEEKTEDSL